VIQVNVYTQIKNSSDKSALFIERASERFRVRAEELVRARVASRPGEPYQITVDSRNVADIGQVASATKYVRLDFIQDIIKIGLERLGSLEQILKSSHQRSKYVPSWMDDRPAQVTVLYVKKDESRFRTIGSTSDIEYFEPGDKIFLVPDFASQMYSNTRVWHGVPTGAGGFMAKASAAIRRSAGLLKRQSVIHVSAVRSIGVYKKMIESGERVYRTGGRKPIMPSIKGKNQATPTGAWAIMIAYRKGAL